jgi:hypothetical protein
MAYIVNKLAAAMVLGGSAMLVAAAPAQSNCYPTSIVPLWDSARSR